MKQRGKLNFVHYRLKYCASTVDARGNSWIVIYNYSILSQFNPLHIQSQWKKPEECIIKQIRISLGWSNYDITKFYCLNFSCTHRAEFHCQVWGAMKIQNVIPLTFRHRASCILGQAFQYYPENTFYIFNQQIYFIIWYLLDRASLI